MEIGDPPLMNSWAPEAMELFADEFQELEELARAEQATFTHTLETSRVQATSEVETFLQRTTTTQVSHRKAPKSTRSHDDRGGHQAAAEKERLIRQKMDEVRRRHDAQMWRQLVKGYDSDLKEVQRSVDPVKTRELKEYDFFCGQNLEFFSMDDILCEDRFRAPNSHAGTASMANTFTDTTATAKPTELVAPARRGSATKRRRTSPPAGRQLSSARPSSSPMSRELREEFSGTTTMNTTMPTSPPFIIDAVGFARDYNRALEEEYGYKTVLGAPRMPEAVTAEDELRARLESHRPGLDTEPPVFCSSPNTNPAAVGEPSATQKGTARSSVLHFPMVEAALPSDGAMNSTMEGTRGCLKNGPRGHSAFTLPRLSVGGTTEAADSSTSPAALTAAAEPSTKLVQPPAPTGSNTLGVECSAKNQRVELRTLTGVEQTVVVRFTNRNAERTRLRVHPSTHSWIRVRCTKICPVAGKADKSMNYANPVSCGGYIEVEVVFKPMDTSEPRFDAHLQIGVTRELNARSAVGAQWQFVDVVLHCETVLPEFHFCCSDGDDASTGLRSVSGTLTSTDLRALKNKHYTRECQFPPTFIMAEAGLHYYLENIGSASVVSVQCESPSFLLTPAPDTVTELANGDALELQLTFSPTVEGPCEANMVVTVREQRDGPVVSEHFFRMRGEGILPHVNILSVDTMAIECSGRPQWVLTPEEGVPRYVALNATPDVPITVPVIVENTSAVSLPFYWRYESAADEDGGEQCIRDPSDMRIVPASGTLPPFTTITCTLFMVPKSTAPVVTSWNLFIDGLPNPVSANAAVLPYIEDSIVRFFSRDKWIPSAAAGALQRKAYTLTDPNTSADAYADPFAAFQQCLARQMDLGIDGTFATGFFVFAQPVAPSALFIPQCLDEAVECLVNYENVRHITVRNDSPRPLHFIFDPTEAESNGHADPRKKQTEASPVAVSFRPRTGVIAPFASSVVTVRFTVRTAGKHRASVDCYIQEIMSRRPAGAPCSHALDIHVTGVGASVHTSTELLDFGLIELGHEGEASFTVTNDNPIPVVFDMQDPLMREPPRFAFIPPFFRLSAGDSVEVTVYRKAVSLDDAQTFFELVIRDGCTIAIETRATIQSPMMILDESVVNFGVVPEGVWQNANFYLSNASALDVPFSIELASPASPSIRLDFQSEHILRAGQSHVAVPVRGLFACSNTAVDPANADLQHRALLAIRSKRNQQVLLLELTCDTVERLSVSADLIPIPKRYTFTELTSFFKHAGESTDVMVQGEEMPVDLFVRALLDNLILEKVFNHSSVDDGQRFKGLPPRHPAGEGEKEHLTRIIDPELSDRHCQCSSLQPYCPTAHLRVELPDHSPILAEHLAIVIRNYTGCVSDYRLEPLFFGPIPCSPPSPRNSEQAGVMGTMTNATITGPLQLTASPSTGGDGRESQLDAGWKTGSIVSLAASATNIGRSSRSMENRVENAIAWGPDGERPAFWTTAINSTEKRERQRRAALAGAQNLLLDGRGCCSALECLLSNDLNPYAQVHLPLSLIANLPGVYEEKIRVTCGELPAMDLPVVLEVQGKPLLLDPTTSGLTMSGNREVLLMPPVIASIGTSRRNLRLMNRVPRDISVRVEIFLSAATFGVTAVEENADASQVTLTLAPLTQQERERSAVGAASVTPAALFMPAMSHKEILIEYTPDAAIVADVVERMNAELQTQAADEDEDDDRVKEAASQEVDWTGSLVIYAELARSSFNDAFLIDEFYHANATRYPSTRKIRRKGGLGEGGAMPSWMTSIIRSIPMLYVSRPLRTRPGHVIRLNKLLKPSEAEKFLVQRELHRREVTTSRANLHSANSRTAGSCSFATRATSACSMATSAQPPTSGSLTQEPSGELHSQWSESTSDEDGEEDVNIPLLNETGGAVRPLDELLDEEEERRDLMKYLTRRREEVRLASLTSFTPIELQLRSRCGVPRLAVQPSEFGVEFPRYHPGQWCGRTIRLTNHNSAALLFTLESLQPALFHISKVELVPSEVEEDPLIEDDEESRRCRRELKTLKWGNVVEQQRALEMMRNVDEVSRGGQRATSVAVATIGSAGGAQQLVYQLRCEDSMDVTVQLVDPTNYLAAHANILQKEKRMSMESALRMHFINPDRLLSANDDHRRSRPPTASSQHQSSRTLAPMTLAEQTISLRATFTTPIVTCHPSVVWFRPGHTVTDGRPQPSYTQRLTLSNNEEESVPFELRPVSLSRAQKMIGESVVSITCERQDLTMDRKVAEVINMPLPIPPPPPGEPTLVEDSTRFELSTLCGVLPPATAGGQPGLAEVTVQFTEHSNVRYECAYSVFIKGQPADTYVLLRGDSRETEI